MREDTFDLVLNRKYSYTLYFKADDPLTTTGKIHDYIHIWNWKLKTYI